MIDMYTVQLFSDRFDQKRCYNRAVYTAGQGQQHLTVAYLLADRFDLVRDKILHIPVGFRLAGVKNKRLDQCADLLTVSGSASRAVHFAGA